MNNDNGKWDAYHEEQDRLANGEKICDRCGEWHKNKSGYNQSTGSWDCKNCEGFLEQGGADCASCGEDMDLDNLHEDSLDIPHGSEWTIQHYGATFDESNCAADLSGWITQF